MAFLKDEIKEIFSKHHYKSQRIFTWKGLKKIKLIDKPAVLRDMWKVFSREINEQRLFLENQVTKMRLDIEAEKQLSDNSLKAIKSGHLVEELQSLCRELEGEFKDKLLFGKSPALSKMQVMLGQAFEDRLEEVDEMEKNSAHDIERLRRRLVRMAKDLTLSEDEVGRLRGALEAVDDGGVASIYQSVQGLAKGADNFEKKRDLLKSLFDDNRAMRNG